MKKPELFELQEPEIKREDIFAIVMRIAVKPPSSIAIPQRTVDRSGVERDVAVTGRHDPCLCPRIVPVAEAMTCLVLADALLRQRAIEPWRPRDGA